MRFSNTNLAKGLLALVLSGAILVLVGCTSPTTTNTPSTPVSTPTPASTASPTSPSTGTVTIDLVAQDFAFDKSTISVPSGASVTINFNNKDTGVSHNFALYTDSTAATVIFKGQIVSGPATMTYKFTAPTQPGTYFFRCDIHPTTMSGTFLVQ